MTEIQDPPIPRRHDARLLLEDLACLTALQDTARQLAADIATAGRGGQRPDPLLLAAFTGIRADDPARSA